MRNCALHINVTITSPFSLLPCLPPLHLGSVGDGGRGQAGRQEKESERAAASVEINMDPSKVERKEREAAHWFLPVFTGGAQSRRSMRGYKTK